MTNHDDPIRLSNGKITIINLADLPSHDVKADISITGQEIVEYFDIYPNLPGIIITKEGQFYGLIPRKKFFENLSKPFGVEVYLKRPAVEMLKNLNTPILKFPQDVEISKTVQKALSRDQDNIYDPILVEQDGDYRIIDMYTLLISMAQSLDNANQIIYKQFQIAHQLTENLNYKNVFHSILEKTINVIAHDEGIILQCQAETWRVIAHEGSFPLELLEELVKFRSDELLGNIPRVNEQVTHNNLFAFKSDSFVSSDFVISSLAIPLNYSEFSLGALLLLRIEYDQSGVQTSGNSPEKEKTKRAFIPFQKLDEILLGNLEPTFSSAIRNTQLISQIQDLAVTDTLTNIKNRRGFYSEANRGFLLSQKEKTSLCVLIVDIDHFKSVNDIFGHAIGDEVIRVVVEEIKTCLRDTDLLGRYGGDEFVILLPDANLEIAENVALRIRREISDMMISTPKGDILITVSIGACEMDLENDDLDSLINHADESLLLAKSVGRNQTVVYNQGKFYNNGFPVQMTRLKTMENEPGKFYKTDYPVFNGIDEISLEQTIDDLILGYVHALELRDKETEGHTQRVARMTVDLAIELGVNELDLVDIKRGALLHDIGKIAIPDQILLKPGPLNDKEWEIMRKHPVYAYDLLSNNVFLRSCLDIPYNHHERWDGQGYPRKLEKTQIPLSARIFSVVDVWDALISQRPYRPAWSREEALAYIREQAGKQFDPAIVPVFLRMITNQSL